MEGSIIKVVPKFTPMRVKDKTNRLTFEQGTCRLVTHLIIKNDSDETYIYKNGDIFGKVEVVDQ